MMTENEGELPVRKPEFADGLIRHLGPPSLPMFPQDLRQSRRVEHGKFMKIATLKSPGFPVFADMTVESFNAFCLCAFALFGSFCDSDP